MTACSVEEHVKDIRAIVAAKTGTPLILKV